MEIEILTAEIEGKLFGIRSQYVSSVVRAATLTSVPDVPASIEGVLNIRGDIIPVVDLRALCQLPPVPMRHSHHMIVLNAGGHRVAIRVDRALELEKFTVDGDAATGNTDSHSPKMVELIVTRGSRVIDVIEPRGMVHAAGAAEAVTRIVAAAARGE